MISQKNFKIKSHFKKLLQNFKLNKVVTNLHPGRWVESLTDPEFQIDYGEKALGFHEHRSFVLLVGLAWPMSYGPVHQSFPPVVSLFFHPPESSRARGQPLFQYAGAATLPPSGEAVTIPATARHVTSHSTTQGASW